MTVTEKDRIGDLYFTLSYALLPATEEQEEPTPWRDLAINSNVQLPEKANTMEKTEVNF